MAEKGNQQSADATKMQEQRKDDGADATKMQEQRKDDGVTVDKPETTDPQPLHKRGSETVPAGAMAASVDESNDPVKAMRASREQALRDGDTELADRLGKSLGDQQ